MTDSERVRMVVIVRPDDGESAEDAAMRTKRLLRGMDRGEFSKVSIPVWKELEGDKK